MTDDAALAPWVTGGQRMMRADAVALSDRLGRPVSSIYARVYDLRAAAGVRVHGSRILRWVPSVTMRTPKNLLNRQSGAIDFP